MGAGDDPIRSEATRRRRTIGKAIRAAIPALVLELFSAVTLDATKIWWGDESGPSGEGPGTGDSVISNSGTVLFDPWLTDVITSADNCETFSSSFDSGSLHEWGVIHQ